MQILSHVAYATNLFNHKISSIDIPRVNITPTYLFIWRLHCSYLKTNICTKTFFFFQTCTSVSFDGVNLSYPIQSNNDDKLYTATL